MANHVNRVVSQYRSNGAGVGGSVAPHTKAARGRTESDTALALSSYSLLVQYLPQRANVNVLRRLLKGEDSMIRNQEHTCTL